MQEYSIWALCIEIFLAWTTARPSYSYSGETMLLVEDFLDRLFDEEHALMESLGLGTARPIIDSNPRRVLLRQLSAMRILLRENDFPLESEYKPSGHSVGEIRACISKLLPRLRELQLHENYHRLEPILELKKDPKIEFVPTRRVYKACIAAQAPVYRNAMALLLDSTGYFMLQASVPLPRHIELTVESQCHLLVMEHPAEFGESTRCIGKYKEVLKADCIVIYSGRKEIAEIDDCFQAGAHGYVLKTDSIDVTLQVILKAMSGWRNASAQVHFHHPRLSKQLNQR